MQPSPYQQSEGWLPDPLGRYEYRWFNGMTWTADVSTGGQRYVDPYGAMPVASAGTRNGAATASVVLGVIAALITWIPFVVAIGIVLAVIAIILGVSSRRKASATGQTTGAGTAGIVTGSIALLLSVVGIWLTVMAISIVAAFANPGPYSVVVDRCVGGDSTITVTATLTNESESTKDYTVFARSTTGGMDPEFARTLIDVEPDEARQFTMEYVDFADEFACPVRLNVYGPLPLVTLGTTDD